MHVRGPEDRTSHGSLECALVSHEKYILFKIFTLKKKKVFVKQEKDEKCPLNATGLSTDSVLL